MYFHPICGDSSWILYLSGIVCIITNLILSDLNQLIKLKQFYIWAFLEKMRHCQFWYGGMILSAFNIKYVSITHIIDVLWSILRVATGDCLVKYFPPTSSDVSYLTQFWKNKNEKEKYPPNKVSIRQQNVHHPSWLKIRLRVLV